MSIESAKAFLERMETDKVFCKKVAACKDAAARLALVKAEGFDFSAQEIKKLTPQLVGATGGGRLAGLGGAKLYCDNCCVTDRTLDADEMRYV